MGRLINHLFSEILDKKLEEVTVKNSCSIQSSDFDQSSQTLGEKTSTQLSKLHSTYPGEILGC